jgi:hypothetical protein
MKKILHFIAVAILAIAITHSNAVYSSSTENLTASNITKPYQLQLYDMFPHVSADSNDGHGC